MKGIIVLLSILYCHAAMSKNNATLRGVIKHPLADSIVLSYSIPSLSYRQTTYTASIDKNGSFNIPFEVPKESIRAYIRNGSQLTELYVSPGTDLAVSIDGNNFDSSVHYEGKGSELANFMAGHVLEHNMMQNFGGTVQTHCGKEIKEYKAALKKMEDDELRYLRVHGAKLPSSFKEYYKTYYHYMVYAAMGMYPRIHEMMKQQTNDFPVIPKETYSIINDIPEEFNDRHINNEGYFFYVTNFFYLKTAAATPSFDTSTDIAKRYDNELTLSYKHMPPKTAEFHIGRSIYLQLKNSPIELIEQEYKKYKSTFPNSKYLPELEAAISFKKTFGIGVPAIDFEINTPDGEKMKLSDLKGNVVYIDFWERSCAPCMAEMPHAKKIKEHFKDKPVKFVYVSADNDKVWRAALQELQIDGIHTRAGSVSESELMKQYAIHGFPTYYIIDKEGKFASVENVLRPHSSEKLINKIETLLKK